jgi:hypothetical protein
MAKVTIPFDGKPLSFEVPERNLAEILSPKPSTPLSGLGWGDHTCARRTIRAGTT